MLGSKAVESLTVSQLGKNGSGAVRRQAVRQRSTEEVRQ
jgi:hypothetical protein